MNVNWFENRHRWTRWRMEESRRKGEESERERESARSDVKRYSPKTSTRIRVIVRLVESSCFRHSVFISFNSFSVFTFSSLPHFPIIGLSFDTAENVPPSKLCCTVYMVSAHIFGKRITQTETQSTWWDCFSPMLCHYLKTHCYYSWAKKSFFEFTCFMHHYSKNRARAASLNRRRWCMLNHIKSIQKFSIPY